MTAGPGAGRVDPRVRRARASAAIARLALQQLRDELSAGPVDKALLAETLRELHREADPDAGVFGILAQLLTAAGEFASLTDITDDDSGDVACALEEAAAYVSDSAGMRLHLATRTLHPQGERE